MKCKINLFDYFHIKSKLMTTKWFYTDSWTISNLVWRCFIDII